MNACHTSSVNLMVYKIQMRIDIPLLESGIAPKKVNIQDSKYKLLIYINSKLMAETLPL